MNDSAETLGNKLGRKTHGSLLLEKAGSLGLYLPEDFHRLAVARGCKYYTVEEGPMPPANLSFSNSELAVALLSPSLPPQPMDIRIAAVMLSAPDVEVSTLANLAEADGCAGLVRYIAECGQKYEPFCSFWSDLQQRLRDAKISDYPLPHPTRFIEMTGMIRGKTGFFTHWIRPGKPKD